MSEFSYSAAFVEHVVELHRGKESWPNYQGYLRAHLAGSDSRLDLFRRTLIPEVEARCGPLRDRSVLDFGCGTGATTVALAERGALVTGFDIDARSAHLAKLRLREHALEGGTAIWSAPSIEGLGLGTFDLVLMNGVVEHIPATAGGLRESVLRQAWSLLRDGGHLYINETPNRLCPFDSHSTQLWWIPWSRPGSEWAYRRAVARGRHSEAPSHSAGPRGLEEVGAWGATFWELKRYLEGLGAECLNMCPAHSGRLTLQGPRSWKRRIVEAVGSVLGERLLQAPLTAFMPYLNHLVFRKVRSASDHSAQR